MTTRRTTLGSLCSGYGGLDLAVQRVFGGEHRFVADNDPACVRVLAARFPQAVNLGDVTAVDWHRVPKVTVLAVSPPCQPFSLAGKRRGADDPRHLWPHIHQALAVLRPEVLVFEQVPGHISLGLRETLASLDQLGYVGRWGVVAAAHAGAPHLRRRLFLIGELAAAHPARLGGGAAADPPDALPDLAAARALARRRDRRTRAAPPEAAAHPDRVRRDEGLPGAPVLQRPDPVLPRRRPHESESTAAHSESNGHRNPGPTREPGLPPAPVPGSTGDGPLRVDWGEYTAAIRRWEHVLGRPAPAPADTHRRLRGALPEWMQGLDEGWITAVPGLTRADHLRLAGGGVNPRQAELALRLLLEPPTKVPPPHR